MYRGSAWRSPGSSVLSGLESELLKLGYAEGFIVEYYRAYEGGMLGA